MISIIQGITEFLPVSSSAHVNLLSRIFGHDDIEIIIPNSVIATSKIVNESGGPEEIERVRITMLVSYKSDIDEVLSLIHI